jgi:hypothetical protein
MIKRYSILCLFLAAIFGACDPAPSSRGGPAPVHASIPPPTGTGFPHVTAGKQDSAARAVDVSSADVTGKLPFANIHDGTSTNDVLTWSGSAWTSAAAGSSGIAFVKLYDIPQLASRGGDWTLGNYTGGRYFAVTNQAVTITGVKFYAQWSGGGSRSIKVGLCTCSTVSCSASTSTATATDTVASGTIATISFASPQTLAATVNAYTVTVYDTTGTNYPRANTCPLNLGGGGACSALGGVGGTLPWYADASGHEVWLGPSMYNGGGDGCPGTQNGSPLTDFFMTMEPVMQ